MKKLLRALRNDGQFFLWLLMPVLLGTVCAYVVTDFIYSGGRRENIAAMAEGFLIQKTFHFSPYEAKRKGEVVIISADDDDYQSLDVATFNSLRDLSIEEYARMALVLAKARPRFAVFNWLYYAHDESASGLEPFLERLENLDNKSKILLSFPTKNFHSVPRSIKERLHVVEGNDCVYEINAFCSFNPEWQWVIQYLPEQLWHPIPKYHVSDNLPHKLPNYVLHLPKVSSIPRYSFLDVLSGKVPVEKLADKVVLVGNHISQDRRFANSKYSIERTYTSLTGTDGSLLEIGVPFHVFWAQLSQMYIDQETIAVPPRKFAGYISLGVCLIILFALARMGPAASFGTFLFYVTLYPLVNVVLVHTLNVYIPMFDVIYAGLIAFLSSSFLFLSYASYQNWRAAALELSYQSTADLKSNFVSLISHNLNTPIAKLQGLIDLFFMKKELDEGLVNRLRAMCSRMQLSVRTVLLLSGLEQGELARNKKRLNIFVEDLQGNLKGTLDRLGVNGEVTVDKELEEENPELTLDSRLVEHLVALLFALGPPKQSKLKLEIGLVPLKAGYFRFLLMFGNEYEAPDKGDSFTDTIAKRFINKVVSKYEGSFRRSSKGMLAELFIQSN